MIVAPYRPPCRSKGSSDRSGQTLTLLRRWGKQGGAVSVSNQSRSGSLNPSSTRGIKAAGVETIDEGMVKPPGHRDNAILQFSRGERGDRRTAYSAWVIEVKWSHGRQLAQIKCSPSTMSGAGMSLLPRQSSACRGAEGGELGGVVAPHLTESLSDGHHGVITPDCHIQSLIVPHALA